MKYATFDSIDQLNTQLEDVFQVFPRLITVKDGDQIYKMGLCECNPDGYVYLKSYINVSDMLQYIEGEMGQRWMRERKLLA